MVYNYERIKHEVISEFIAYNYERVQSQIEADGTAQVPEEKTPLFSINFFKLKKKGFYRMQVVVVKGPGFLTGDNLLNPIKFFQEYFPPENLEGLFETKSLNAKELFSLADKLSSELMKERNYAFSIGDLADLPKYFRKDHLKLEVS